MALKTDQIGEYLESVNTEHVVLFVFSFTSLYIFLGSFGFSDRAGQFPKITSGVTLICVALLLARNYLPKPVRDGLFGSSEIVDQSEIKTELNEISDSETEDDSTDRVLPNHVFAGVLIVAYVASGLLFGFLWVSPIFVATYMIWFEQSWLAVVGSTLLVSLIGWVFLTVVGAPVDEGLLIEF